MRARCADEVSCGLALVATKVVCDHDVAGREGRDEALRDPGGEAVAVDRPIQNEGCHDAVMAQPSEESEGLPMPMRDMGRKPRAAQAPTSGLRHVGLDPGFVQEYQPLGVKPMLVFLPALPEARHFRA